MPVHLHHLHGCSPSPLAYYLKAIGILRIVAQKDHSARGYWQSQHFCILSKLDSSSLEEYFLNEYSPTPWISPWNKGSGFYDENDKGLYPIENSKAIRFKAFRDGISEARKHLNPMLIADKKIRDIKSREKSRGLEKKTREKQGKKTDSDSELKAAEREFKKLKAKLYEPIALEWRGRHREWLDAVLVMATNGDLDMPALLGTGGNDGNLDFSNTAMQRLGDLFDLASETGEAKPYAKKLLLTALFDIPSIGLTDAAVGLFLPYAAGGANGTTGTSAEPRINPWDYILLLEGAIAFRSHATRRFGTGDNARAAIPFAVISRVGGNPTSVNKEDSHGEQWMPLWERPASWGEISTLIGEGRAQIGRSTSRRPLDFARSISRLGVSRGLTGFVRYGYLTRNGQSTLAVPMGRIEVATKPYVRLIDEISSWLESLQREAEDKDAPSRISVSVGVLADAVFKVLTRESDPLAWQTILLAIGSIEEIQARGTSFKVGPCPRLSPDWLLAAADNSPEWHLAIALGSAAREYKYGRPIDSVRTSALPLESSNSSKYKLSSNNRLVCPPRVVMLGRDALNDLIALVERRLIEASQRGDRKLPLSAAPGAGASLNHIARFIAGDLDVDRIVNLGRALMTIKWELVRIEVKEENSFSYEYPQDGWMAVRLCTLPFRVQEVTIPTPTTMFRRLVSGDAAGAVDVALRRLRASGLHSPIASSAVNPLRARLWAAALALPISPSTARNIAKRFQLTPSQETK